MAKIDIYSPRENFSGVVGGVVFSGGHGVVDDESQASTLRYFRRQGYSIGERPDVAEVEPEPAPVEEPEPVVEEEDVPGRPRVNDSRGEWAEHAESLGIETEGLKKDQIIEAVKAASES